MSVFDDNYEQSMSQKHESPKRLSCDYNDQDYLERNKITSNMSNTKDALGTSIQFKNAKSMNNLLTIDAKSLKRQSLKNFGQNEAKTS